MAGFGAREDFLSVEVDGPGSFARALRKADKDLARDFSKAIRGQAAEVRDDARARYRGRYRQRSGHSVRGITSTVSYGSGRVRFARNRPWLVGQEWGGYASRFHPHNLPTLRGGTSGVGGTFLWPAAVASTNKVTETTSKAIDSAMATLRGPSGGRRGG